jgi:hypothetical protein
MSFSVQPRPFEGESWDLVQGERVVEGIQEFVTIVNVPYNVQHLQVFASTTIGFRSFMLQSMVTLQQPPLQFPYPAGTLFTRALDQDYQGFPDRLYAQIPDFLAGWKDWSDGEQAWRDLIALIETREKVPTLLVTDIGFRKEAPLYQGNDPCADIVIDPCHDKRPLILVRDLPVRPDVHGLFSEIVVKEDRVPGGSLSRRDAANLRTLAYVRTLSSAAQFERHDRRLDATDYYGRLIIRTISRLAHDDPRNLRRRSLKKRLATQDWNCLSKLGVQTVREVIEWSDPLPAGVTSAELDHLKSSLTQLIVRPRSAPEVAGRESTTAPDGGPIASSHKRAK